MPCYEVNLVSVEFKVKYENILFEALNKLNWQYTKTAYGVYISAIGAEIYLNEGRVKIPEGSYAQNKLNELKRTYSEVILDLVAKKRRWVKKQINQGQYQLTKY